MKHFDESEIEYASMVFDRQKVVCYGMNNFAGGMTTVLNFPTVELAGAFREVFLSDRNFQTVQNEAQLICFADYDSVMRTAEDDPRVRPLCYNRDFLMGTLAHLA